MTARVALVTGSGRNIGRAIALALAADRLDVAVHSRRDGDPDAAAVAAEIAALGRRAVVVSGDVTVSAEVDAMVARAVGSLGSLDVLVNNAAVRRRTPLGEITDEEWRLVTAATLDGAFFAIRAALPHLLAAPASRVVNIGGVSGHAGAAERAHVVAAKAGLVGLTKAVAVEFAARGLTANCVVPGPIDTARAAALGSPPGYAPPVGRLGRPEEIAGAVAWLVRPEAAFVTGATLHVNGGTWLA